MTDRCKSWIVGAILLAATSATAPDARAQTQTDSAAASATYSGYRQTPTLEGPDGVVTQLDEGDVRTQPVLSFPKVEAFFQPFFDWKARINKDYGLKLQFSYQVLYQGTNEDVPYTSSTAGRAQIQGAWTLVDRGGKNPGLLTFRLENRYTIDSEIPPSQFGFQFGSLTPTGGGFSDFGFAWTELAWRQTLMDGKFKFIVGKISATSWYNGYALSSPMTGFQNTGLQSSLTKPAPGRGIGGGIGYQFNPNFVMVAGVHDANAKTADNPFDTIHLKEFYYSTEFRWYTTTPDRSKWDQVRVQFWYQDPLEEKGTPAGYGMTFAASHLFQDRYMPFILGGISNGEASTFQRDLIAGLGIGFDTVHRTASDVLGVAVGWGDPYAPQLREQYTAEAFYRFQLVQRVAITPSVQYVKNPSANPNRDDAWLWGLRARVTF
ncbi:carbohydrate porin [Palleronia sp. KMU-117]|uniref:carbohydrate porin n=1 Tax=Palleronia sp. KMU-117 TaxID=3434108 RepID=UPI003D753995